MNRSTGPSLQSLVPHELRGRRQAPQIFVEVLEHWQRWSAELGADLDLFDAARRYVDEVLAGAEDEQIVGTAD